MNSQDFWDAVFTPRAVAIVGKTGPFKGGFMFVNALSTFGFNGTVHVVSTDNEGGLLDDEDRDRSAAQGAGPGDDEVQCLGVALLGRAGDASAEDQPRDEQGDADADDGRDADEEGPPLSLEVLEADHRAEVDDDEADHDPREAEQ